MSDAQTLSELWTVLAKEAFALIPADGTVVVEHQKRLWSPLAIWAADDMSTEGIMASIEAAGHRGCLKDPYSIHDAGSGLSPNGWGSILVVGLDRRPSRAAIRLLWFAKRPDGFTGCGALAELMARQASLAVRAVGSRVTLGEAVDARHRIGQAQGVLMARYHLTADQAFALLVRQSQHTNTKLRTIAERIVLTGDLDGPVGNRTLPSLAK